MWNEMKSINKKIENNSRTISPKGEEIRHGSNPSNYNNSSDKLWSIHLNIVNATCIFWDFYMWKPNNMLNVDI